MHHDSSSQQAEEFIRVAISAVPDLEALLLLWTTRPRGWTAADVAAKIYIDSPRAEGILEMMSRRGLLIRDEQHPDHFRYNSVSAQQDALMLAVEQLYKTDLIRITRMIHSKASSPIRDFAQAFRLKKE
jgi:hypothetical protein